MAARKLFGNPRRSPTGVSRRNWLALSALGGAVAAWAVQGSPPAAHAEEEKDWTIQHGRIKQSVVKWCFDPLPLDDLCRAAAALGLKSVEVVAPQDWPTLQKYGLICAMTPTHTFVRGLNHLKYHAECLEKLTTAINATADAKFPNVITFSGMAEGLSDEEGMANTVTGLKQILPLAEQRGVNICIEPLNTRVDVTMKGHPGYQCDKVEWAVEVCNRIGSPRLKILFDIYHTQIMQGDVITRIRQFKDYIGHYHTAGVPGRNELDGAQEINYPAIMRTILETGYEGFVGQEFIPTEADKIAALRRSVQLCDV